MGHGSQRRGGLVIMGSCGSPTVRVVGFLLTPGFSLMALSSATEPLRSANRLSGRSLYVIRLLSADGGAVATGGGIRVLADAAIAAAERCDLILVVGGVDGARYRDAAVFDWLRRRRAEGVALGALSTGPIILARAGVLRGRCTVHWENRDDLQDEFPQLDVTSDLFCVADGVMTCAGGTAALDMMLSMIAGQHGAALAAAVADQFIHGRIRESGESQRLDIRWRYDVADTRVVEAIRLMEEHLEDPLSPADIARLVGCSQRHLERLFAAAVGRSPTAFCAAVRLRAAHGLLRRTGLSLDEIARRTGFASAEHFGRRFSAEFGVSPGAVRRRTSRPPRA